MLPEPFISGCSKPHSGLRWLVCGQGHSAADCFPALSVITLGMGKFRRAKVKCRVCGVTSSSQEISSILKSYTWFCLSLSHTHTHTHTLCDFYHKSSSFKLTRTRRQIVWIGKFQQISESFSSPISILSAPQVSLSNWTPKRLIRSCASPMTVWQWRRMKAP